MSTTIYGALITNKATKSKTSKAGRAVTLHYLYTSTGQEISTGFKDSGLGVGNTYDLNVESKFGELQLVSAAAASGKTGTSDPVAPASPPSGGGGRNVKFPVPKGHGDFAIIRQNALTNAVATVRDYLAAHGTVYTEINSYVEEIIKVAYKFADFSSGHREEKILEKALIETKE